ncbi:hypothetical protein EK21DRAFT_105934 [Setomelanomma holmii]|uniref:Uncharacterized protein n=1 Tax=Setomelanomma holmii TaxID=210430 RepID=A0A9P4HNV2_9PLEO|nr:hypothetical protein EK21DRAFT_105934 [Setomelanomma holmii]
MLATKDAKHALVATKTETEPKTPAATTSFTTPNGVDLIRLPIEEDDEPPSDKAPRSIFHIYTKHEVHKCLSPTVDPSKERWSGPTPREQAMKRMTKKERKTIGLPLVHADDNAFFLHRPYLALHMPPRVLYMGNSKHGTKPAVLIHEGWFWKEYKLQLGPSIAKQGVIDPRGVVAWVHNGGDKTALKADDRKLKGYKVRKWRLWGENGKDYVHSVAKNSKAGEGPNPDLLGDDPPRPERADEVVYLRWTSPLSRHTRRYHFQYASIDFYWKGTGTVKETRRCGSLLRFNHLKLVAQLPLCDSEKEKGQNQETCLGDKSGVLDLFDTAILRLVEEHAPSMLEQDPFGDQADEDQTSIEEDQRTKISKMKRSRLYQVIVATATCMIITEKEKRHTLRDLILAAAEGGGGAGS